LPLRVRLHCWEAGDPLLIPFSQALSSLHSNATNSLHISTKWTRHNQGRRILIVSPFGSLPDCFSQDCIFWTKCFSRFTSSRGCISCSSVTTFLFTLYLFSLSKKRKWQRHETPTTRQFNRNQAKNRIVESW
jgi:hypothetical protein